MRKFLYLLGGFLLFSISSTVSAITLTSSELKSLDELYDVFHYRCKPGFVDLGYMIYDMEWTGSCLDMKKLTPVEQGYLLKRVQQNNVIVMLRLEKTIKSVSIKSSGKNLSQQDISGEIAKLTKKNREYGKWKKEFQNHIIYLNVLSSSPEQIKELDITKDHLKFVNMKITNLTTLIRQYKEFLKSK